MSRNKDWKRRKAKDLQIYPHFHLLGLELRIAFAFLSAWGKENITMYKCFYFYFQQSGTASQIPAPSCCSGAKLLRCFLSKSKLLCFLQHNGSRLVDIKYFAVFFLFVCSPFFAAWAVLSSGQATLAIPGIKKLNRNPCLKFVISINTTTKQRLSLHACFESWKLQVQFRLGVSHRIKAGQRGSTTTISRHSHCSHTCCLF